MKTDRGAILAVAFLLGLFLSQNLYAEVAQKTQSFAVAKNTAVRQKDRKSTRLNSSH